MTTAPIESVFSRAWQLLSGNWIMIVPGVIIGAIVGIVTAVASLSAQPVVSADGTYHMYNAMGAALTGIVAGVIGLVGFVATQAYTVGMAGAAWTRGTTTLADGSAAFRDSAGNIIMTAIGLILLAIVAAILVIPTLGLSLLAFVLFTLYAMPSAIIGRNPGFSAIGESFRITMRRFVPTLIIAILVGVISLVAGFVTLPLHFIPLLGPIVAAILTQIIVVYAVLVIVGEYLALRGAPAAAAGYGAAPTYSSGPAAYQPPPSDTYTPPVTDTYTPPPSAPPPPPA